MADEERGKFLIFLNHSGQQKHIAEDLYNKLSVELGDGEAIFFDRSEQSIRMGGSIPDSIMEAVGSCKIGVVLLSEKFIESRWPMRELHQLVLRRNHCTIYPIFYDLDMRYLKTKDAILERWGERWTSFGEEADVDGWAHSLHQVGWMRGDILQPNNTVSGVIHRIASSIVQQLPPRFRPPPSRLQVPGHQSVMEIEKQLARCKYTTEGSLFRAYRHVSFYMYPIGHNANSHRPRAILGQRPEAGPPTDSVMVDTLVFADAAQANAKTRPIGPGNEWWDLMWTDRGSFVHPSDHSCWRVRRERIPEGFVCLSPCLFKIDSLSQRMSRSWIPRGFAGFNDGHPPPSDEDVRGMVAIKQDLVTYVSGEQLIRLWDDKGSKATQDLSVYTGPDFLGCFAFPTHNPPTGGNYPVLDRSRFVVSSR